MKDEACQKLAEMIAKHGRNICEDKQRCKSFLLDYCSGYDKEVKLFALLLEIDIPAELLNTSSGMSTEWLVNRLTKKAYDTLSLDKEAALWGVEAWASALGMSVPVPKVKPSVPRSYRPYGPIEVPYYPDEPALDGQTLVNYPIAPPSPAEQTSPYNPYEAAARPYYLNDPYPSAPDSPPTLQTFPYNPYGPATVSYHSKGGTPPDGDANILRSGSLGIGYLRVEEGKEPSRVYEVSKEALSIGRSRTSDIILEDPAVSRLHASIVNMGNGNYALKDEGSANGTRVNGQLINKFNLYPLQEGTRIQIGQTVFIFGQH